VKVRGSLDGIVKPTSIAVIGASCKKGSIGHSILHNLIDCDFNGKVFPVNPRAQVIHSIKCYSTILDVPDTVDPAIIIVPRDHVVPVLEQCGKKGVKGVVVISSGFKETGEEGAAKEAELMEIIRKYNMRMIGPNCFGVLNTASDILMKEVSFKIHPVSVLDAEDTIESIKGYPLLTGFRGAASVDRECLRETILRLSQLVSDFPQLESFDLNPFIVTADRKTSKAVDARFGLKSNG
jgi:acyl-CoA synthetase (NDP forming)